ncbi:MAG: hypothetical protein JWP45_3603 [Mucilaginibacter sp.]|nr:hypothetical protein [Mucilaginibacter sp.]
MKTTKPLTFLCLVVLLTAGALSSCKKDNTSTPTADSHISLLTTGTWKLQKIEYQEQNGTWTNDSSALDVITLAFNTNNTFSETDQNNNSGSGTWKFSADYSQLTLVGNSYGATYAVPVLTSSSLQFTSPLSGTGYQAERDTYSH